jgi:hypothetical protein
MQTRDIVEQTSNRLDIPETATFSPGKTNASWSWQYVEQGDTNQVTYNFEETNNRFEYESTYERNGGIVFSIEGWHPYDRSQCYAATYVTLAENSMTLHFVINVDGSYSVDTRILFNELETVRYSAIFRPDLSGEIKVYVQGRSTPYIHGSWTASGSGESVYYDSQGIETESHIWN